MRALLVLALCLLALPTVASASRKPSTPERAKIVDAAKRSDLTEQVDCFRVTNVRVSTEGPWAKATLRPCKKSTDAALGVFKKKPGKFTLKALGTSFTGCDLVSKRVAEDLRLFCD
jgi:hypothetical protein